MRLSENKLRRIVKQEIGRVLNEVHGSSIPGKEVEDFDKHDVFNDGARAVNKAIVRLKAAKEMADISENEIQPLINNLEQVQGNLERLAWDHDIRVT